MVKVDIVKSIERFKEVTKDTFERLPQRKGERCSIWYILPLKHYMLFI